MSQIFLLPETITTLGINCECANMCYVIDNIEHNPGAIKMVRNYCTREGVNCEELERINSRRKQ